MAYLNILYKNNPRSVCYRIPDLPKAHAVFKGIVDARSILNEMDTYVATLGKNDVIMIAIRDIVFCNVSYGYESGIFV